MAQGAAGSATIDAAPMPDDNADPAPSLADPPPPAPAAPAPRSRRLRRALRWAGLALLALLVVLLGRAATARSLQVPAPPAADLALDEAALAARLGRAITFQTVSYEDRSRIDLAAFTGLHAALAEMYPKAHAALAREVVGAKSLLFTWKGRDPSRPPVLLMGHLDVVPVEPGAEQEWQRPPFSGAVEGGFVWGRGALDCKGPVLAILEAVELLAAQGFTPARTVYLSFGGDEEISGAEGAKAIAERLDAEGVRLEYVLDEGLAITEGLTPGITAPAALIGLAEKGYVSVELVVEGQGGHSSMPPRPTPAGILARALQRLEESPGPAHLDGPVGAMFDVLGPEMSFPLRFVLSNRWLLAPALERVLAGKPATDALLRTTTAPTLLEGSVKDNVLPRRVRAVVNFRIHPADSVEGVVARARAAIADPRVQVRALAATAAEPSPVSSMDAPGYRSVERSIRAAYPGTLVAPGLVLGQTDARHFARVSAAVYRFTPIRLRDEDLPRIHGLNERVAVKDHAAAARFYAQLLRDTEAL